MKCGLFSLVSSLGIHAESVSASKDGTDESSSLLNPGRAVRRPSEQQAKIVKAILYAVQVFYSFFIM
jgi:copper transporter 1